MNTVGQSKRVLRGIVDGASLIGLIGVLCGVFFYDLKLSSRIQAENIEVKEELVAELEPEPPPPEPVPLELPPEPTPEPPPPLPEIVQIEIPTDPVPRVELRFALLSLGKFGMLTTSGNPDDPKDDRLLMTYSDNGGTNNTRVFVDGSTPNYGAWFGGRVLESNRYDDATASHESGWKFQDVAFRQTVKLVPGDVSRRLDTARVVLVAKNEGSSSRQVGARYMLDTLIGGNDGVPFIVAGQQRLIQDATVFRGREVPDFIRALQNSDLSNPGVIVDIGLRCPNVEQPDEVILTHWPGEDAAWDYDRSTQLGGDSAAGLYFNPAPLGAGESRTMGFTYGLGSISSTSSQNTRLSLTAGGPFKAGGSFWLVALVQAPKAGSKVLVTLPRGMSLGPKETAEKMVTANGALSQISWLITISPETSGSQELSVKLDPEDIVEQQKLVVDAPAVKLAMKAPEQTKAGTPFWVSAMIRNPQKGQVVELTLPNGLAFELNHTAKQAVADGKAFQQVNWLVKSSLQLSGNHQLQIRLEPDNSSVQATVNITPVTIMTTVSTKAPENAPAGKAFWVSALVRNPKPGQRIELSIPEGLTFSKGHVSGQSISTDKASQQFNWLLRSSTRTVGDQKLEFRLSPDQSVETATVTIVASTIIN